jgi:glutathione S-transferase
MCARSEWLSPTRGSNTTTFSFGAPPEFVAKSPLSKIPCWEEGELILPDSSVILSYLEHRYPDPPLVPTAPGPRARALWFEEYADTKVSVTLAGVFFERVVKPAIFKQETNQAVVDQALKQELPKLFEYLTQCLGEDEFMVGGVFSIADIALTSPFVNFAIAGERVDAERWPQIAAYVERVHSLPCYAPIVAGDQPRR